MGVRKDAGELLIHIYKKVIVENDRNVTAENILAETKWNPDRINHAYNYLRDLNLIKGLTIPRSFAGGNSFIVTGLFPEGVDIIEHKPKFRRHFSFEVGIPELFKFSWGADEE